MKTLQQQYSEYVKQMNAQYDNDCRRYGPSCENAFVPMSFEEWAKTLEIKTITIGGIEMAITPERQRRITAAIAETQRQIDREMTNYSEEFRKHDNIAQWQRHIANLQNMLIGA